MNTQRRQWITASALLCAGLHRSALAQTAAPAVWPEILAHLPDAVWSGSARLRFWGFDVYDAQLWVSPGFRASQYGQYPLALSLTYLRTLRGNAIAERSLAEMRRQGPISPEQESRWLSAMQVTFIDVAANDRLTGLHQPGQGADFWLNGKPQGRIMDADFSSRFFGIWLASASSEPEMRRRLLAAAAP
ncbi:MAG: chalcone isomerase family protein [Rhodoferax sp.]